MHDYFKVSSASEAYGVTVGAGLINDFLVSRAGAILLVDSFFETRKAFEGPNTIYVTADESSKSLENIPKILVDLRKKGAGRTTEIVAIGGGVVQDIATFIASVYMRGIPWVLVPTTLLSMADSCIGGKSSINVGDMKNLVGNIYPPKEIVVDVDFVSTLPQKDIVGGLIEAEKICFARNVFSHDLFLDLQPGLPAQSRDLAKVISLSLRTKKWFIEVDEFDKRERLLLNFGHTFGHALESATGYAVAHGVAVGLGMIAAARFSISEGLITQSMGEQVDKLVRNLKSLLKSVPFTTPPSIDLDVIMDKFENDKKHSPTAYRLVCPCGDESSLALIECRRDEASRASLRASYAAAFHALGW